jgi:hypothetical protein
MSVSLVWYALCAKHVEHLCGFHNFSDAFVTGICGSNFNKDAPSKHMVMAAHQRAEALEKGPLPIADIFQ